MNNSQKTAVFSQLGDRLRGLPQEELKNWLSEAWSRNKWFDEENIRLALAGIISFLNEKDLQKWISNYSEKNGPVKNVGIVMAGNIPLVGFHDFLCVLMSGNRAVVKLSSEDSVLTKKIASLLIEIEPGFADLIEFADKLNHVDAVIATGSDNTAKHFEYYFSKIPRIIRKNRVSVAVLDGNETPEELSLLGEDILQYYGLGCRNVSKIFIPENYNIDKFYEAIQPLSLVMNNNKYNNNYEYNRALYLLKSIVHLDNGFLILTETTELISPISVLYYEYYKTKEEVIQKLESKKDKIQCVVSSTRMIEKSFAFGQAQKPSLWDYADNVDTMKFLLNI